jgi:hypothetical protein
MMKLRPGTLRAGPRGTSSIMMSRIAVAPQTSINGAFPLKKVWLCCSIFTRDLWASYLVKEHGRKSFSTRFFLADDHRCCGSDREVLQGVLIDYEIDLRASPGALDHPYLVAFCLVGPGSLGTHKKAPWGLTHQLVAVNKFTKWIEARPLSKIGSKQAVSFV